MRRVGLGPEGGGAEIKICKPEGPDATCLTWRGEKGKKAKGESVAGGVSVLILGPAVCQFLLRRPLRVP